MARRHPASCKRCYVSRYDGVHISARGLCPDCGDARQLENTSQLRSRSGPNFHRWRKQIAASVGGSIAEREQLRDDVAA